jgi:hypothetical protein
LGGSVVHLLDGTQDHRRGTLDRPAHQVPGAIAVLYLGEPLPGRVTVISLRQDGRQPAQSHRRPTAVPIFLCPKPVHPPRAQGRPPSSRVTSLTGPRIRPVTPRPFPGVFRPARTIDVYVRARPVARLGARFPPPYQEPGTGARPCPRGPGFLMTPGHRASSGVCPQRRPGRTRLVPVSPLPDRSGLRARRGR